MSAREIESHLKAHGSRTKAAQLQKYFQTAPGQYGDGDIFIGITVPQVRAVANKYKDLPLTELKKLLASELHEVRLCAVVILTTQFKKSKSEQEQRAIYQLFVGAIKEGSVNNWDLVDSGGPTIGGYLINTPDPIESLRKFAKSKSLWVRRSAVIFTFSFIRIGEMKPTLEICELLLSDSHDLIHKATGWALREMGKRDVRALRGFLTEHSKVMPRTMLRYAIERLPESERKRWLQS